MSNTMKKYIVKKLQRGPTLKLIITVMRQKTDDNDIVTDTIRHDNLSLLVMRFRCSNSDIHMNMEMKKNQHAKNFIISMDIVCEEYHGQFFCSDKWVEFPMKVKSCDSCITYNAYENGYSKQDAMFIYSFEIDVTVKVIIPTPIASMVTNQLYEDKEFTDFLLQGTDGDVPVHKSILLAHSDMVKTMLRSGKWEESKNGHMKVNGATKKTLCDLKAYLYLGTLPEEDLEPLLLIASCYLMDKLKKDCIAKLINTVKPEDIEGLIKFACDNHMPDLIKAILFQTSDNIVTSAYKLEVKNKMAINK